MIDITEKQKEARDIIIDVARNIFARFGFRKTTMDEIAQATHKGKSSIYHYFDSKVDIFQAVVEKESQLLKDEISKAVSRIDNPQNELRVYVTTRMHILKRLGNFYSALKDEYFEHYSFIEKMREKYFRDETNLIKDILDRGVKKGIFVVEDLELTAFAMITALKGFEYLWATENNVSKTEKSIDCLLSILFKGISRA